MEYEGAIGKNVRFALGTFDKLPNDAKEVKVYMRPNSSVLYVIVEDTIPRTYEKVSSIEINEEWDRWINEIRDQPIFIWFLKKFFV